MVKIKVGFSTGNGPLSWIIKKVLGTKYSHTYIELENGAIYEAELTGVRVVKDGSDMNALEEMPVSVSVERYSQILEFLWSHIGKPYQFISLIRILFRIPARDTGCRSFICSELVARALWKELGYESEDSCLDKVTPKDIYERVSALNREKRMRK